MTLKQVLRQMNRGTLFYLVSLKNWQKDLQDNYNYLWEVKENRRGPWRLANSKYRSIWIHIRQSGCLNWVISFPVVIYRHRRDTQCPRQIWRLILGFLKHYPALFCFVLCFVLVWFGLFFLHWLYLKLILASKWDV